MKYNFFVTSKLATSTVSLNVCKKIAYSHGSSSNFIISNREISLEPCRFSNAEAIEL